MREGEVLNGEISFEDLVRKVQQQEDTVVQLLRIIAVTNHKITELQMRHEKKREL